MIKIDNYILKEYKNVTKDDCPSFSGILAGECKGDAWVDNTENPQIAIAYSHAVGSFAFLGSINNETINTMLRDFLNNYLFDSLKEKGVNNFEYSIENDGLKPYIQKMFEEKIVQSEKEYSFRNRHDNNKLKYSLLENNIIKYSLPDNYILQKIDSEFWSKVMNGDFENESFITERLLESWGSIDNFCDKSVGFCITYLDCLAAVILGTARFKNIVPIDMGTKDEFKNKGLGYFLTIEFVNECIKKGLIAQWDCVESNPISYKLAEKAGFELFKVNDVYWFKI